MRYWGILAAKLIVAAAVCTRMARDEGQLYSSRRISAVESLAFPPRSALDDDGFPVQSSGAGSSVSDHLGPAISLPDMRAAAANAGFDRAVRADAVVRAAEAGIHLHVWARHAESSGAAHSREPSRAIGSRTKTSGKSCTRSTKVPTNRRFRAELSHNRTPRHSPI